MSSVTPIRSGDWFTVNSRQHFFPADPRIEEINIEDIAHQLARITRWHGTYDVEFYSVAQHSVLVADLVMEELGKSLKFTPEEIRLYGLRALLHDGHEAYTLDVASPMKRLAQMDGYREMADGIQSLIVEKFGISAGEDADGVIKAADIALLHAEADQLFKPGLEWAEPYPASVLITPWMPRSAESVFLSRFYRIGGGAR